MNSPITYRDGYSLKHDMQPIIEGAVVLPNFNPIELEKAVASIAASYGPGIRGNALIPGDMHRNWAQFFLDTTQGGSCDGTGIVLYYYRGKGAAARFAICEHTKVDGPGANHSRGWHPGSCSKCGLDMTVDSSD
jgi:hypothetical protein